jgi:hypothetical protein
VSACQLVLDERCKSDGSIRTADPARASLGQSPSRIS